ncbi:class I glutamine amidotransferase-like protein [Neoconidiobolus thromboides FSU 785]|nr:class I glutamine amidotransferase-like protein [Neoconidiobolus thromboides FSU 785]
MVRFLKLLATLLTVVHCAEYSSYNMISSDSKNIIEPYFPKQPKYKVGAMLYEEFTMLDLIGPMEVLGGQPDIVSVETIGIKSNSSVYSMFKTMSFNIELSMKQAIEKDWDLLVIPGGFGVDNLIENQEFIEDYKKLIKKSKVVFSVCTGAVALAKTGALNGHEATTNKLLYTKYTPMFPEVNWHTNARWVHHKKFITSSGVTAGIDAAFYILSLMKNDNEADEFSKIIEYTPNKDPDNDPFAQYITHTK